MEKTILDLYKIVLDKFENDKCYLYICNCAEYGLVREDFERFREHFFTQQPTENQYVEFFNEPSFQKPIDNSDSWFVYEYKDGFQSKPYKLRVELLKAIINKLENDIN